MNYNLLDENWIPVLYRDGKVGRVGICKALKDAGRIWQIAASNPMDRVALLRFLLALLYWCKGNPPDNMEAASDESFPPDWFSKLDANRDCFNLLGDGKRFYQYKSGDGKNKKLSANYLVQEVPTGTNLWHFRHSTDGNNGLCPACCAMGLLRLPVFTTSGGRGKPPGVNQKPPIYVIPIGASLAATLRLSWRQVSNLGTPSWEKPDLQLPKTGEVPLLPGLTWLPRRVWLENPGKSEAACISCGNKDILILKCVFAGIGSTKTDEGGKGRIWRDPHVIYITSTRGETTALYPGNALGASDSAAGHWTKIMAGTLRMGEDASVHSLAVGFSTVRNDKYLEATERTVSFPSPPRQIEESVEKFERWQEESLKLIRKVRSSSMKGSSRKHVEIPPSLAAIRPHVESRVSAKAGDLLSGSRDVWEQAAREYRPMMAVIAKSLSPGFTTAALQRRQQIERVVPDMRPKDKTAKK